MPPTTVGVRVAECAIKISAVHYLVLSQSTRVTDGRTDGQNYDSQDRPRICSRGKNGGLDQYGARLFEIRTAAI